MYDIKIYLWLLCHVIQHLCCVICLFLVALPGIKQGSFSKHKEVKSLLLLTTASSSPNLWHTYLIATMLFMASRVHNTYIEESILLSNKVSKCVV